MKKTWKNFKVPNFRNLDTDLVLHNMIFVVIYIGAILMFFSYMLWPLILDFKVKYIEERKQNLILTEVQKDFDSSKDRLVWLLTNNKSLLSRLNNAKSQNIITDLLAQYFSKKSMRLLSSHIDEESQIKTILYQIQVQTEDIGKFWEFITALGESDTSIIISLPVQIQKASMQSRIYDIVFNVETAHNVYKLNPEIKQIVDSALRKK